MTTRGVPAENAVCRSLHLVADAAMDADDAFRQDGLGMRFFEALAALEQNTALVRQIAESLGSRA